MTAMESSGMDIQLRSFLEQLTDSDKCGGLQIRRDIKANRIENNPSKRRGYRSYGPRQERETGLS
jgi:hypothetical protein